MADELITRADAMAQGLKTYFTGKACSRGHASRRKVCDHACCSCSKENSNKYKLENPEKYKELGRQQYRNNKEKCAEQAKRWRKKIGSYFKLRKARDPDYLKEWKSKNRERLNAHSRNYKAKRRSLEGGSCTPEDIQEILKLQKGKCAYCTKKLKKYHLDHITPLSKSGTNSRSNIQATCAKCNQTKWNHDPIDFARSLGKLL